jgi:hypothetical protein
VYRLDGQLTLKLATDRSIYTIDGQARSERTTNATGQDQCALSQGTDDERVVCCALQRRAWDCNILTQLPMFVKVQKPLSEQRRSCGAYGFMQEAYANATHPNQHENATNNVDLMNQIEKARHMIGESIYNCCNENEGGVLI